LLDSLFRGKQQALLKHRGKKMILARLFFRQASRSDGNEREGWARPNATHRPTPLSRRLELPVRAVSHDAQIDVAIGPSFPTRMRAEQVNGSQGQRVVHRFQALCKHLTLALQAWREILEL
jgi:hypothetical protein